MLLPFLALGVLAAAEQPRVSIGGYSPGQWTRTGRADPSAKLELLFMIKQTNVDKLEAILELVSDPRSPEYGNHLTNEEVHALIAPKPEDISAVQRFLARYGVTGVSMTPNSDIVSAVVSVEKAEEMLGAEYHNHAHPSSEHVAMRTKTFTLPGDVAAAVDVVGPTTSLPSVTKPLVYTGNNRVGADNLGVSAKKLRSLYSVGSTVGKAQGNRHAVTGFLKQHFHPVDLKMFWNLEMGGVDAKSPKVKQVGDGVTGATAGVEAELDIEYINALGANIESEFWGFSGASPDNPQNEPFLKWLQVVSNTSDQEVPLIFSTSYGEGETTTTLDTAQRTNTEFIKAGSRGISLLFASGDSGAGCSAEKKFIPNWPAGSPYVTGVGGTTGVPERAVGLASGGFCNRWGRQSWQADAVSTYLSTAANIPDQKFFNQSGRAFPDIAAQATGFTVVANMIPVPGVAGTSCASPTASGVFALLNDLRLAAGKSSLGFLNPFIYQNMDKFNDITEGGNSGCDGEEGFPAAKGWDPVTGVGTPNYEKLAQAVLALP